WRELPHLEARPICKIIGTNSTYVLRFQRWVKHPLFVLLEQIEGRQSIAWQSHLPLFQRWMILPRWSSPRGGSSAPALNFMAAKRYPRLPRRVTLVTLHLSVIQMISIEQSLQIQKRCEFYFCFHHFAINFQNSINTFQDETLLIGMQMIILWTSETYSELAKSHVCRACFIRVNCRKVTLKCPCSKFLTIAKHLKCCAPVIPAN
ncbi:hypothetical protein ANCCAN_02991, partial [Ancylostoma caninum]